MSINKMVIGDQMNSKLVARNLLRTTLVVLVMVASVLAVGNVAFAKETSAHPHVLLADWVNMTASSSVKPPAPDKVWDALKKCLKKLGNGSIGTDKNSIPFWTCMISELGQGTWDANYQYIICTTYWYYDQYYRNKVHSGVCGECYTAPNWKLPCPPTTCPAPKKDQDCCDIKYIKCQLESKGNPIALLGCHNTHTTCYTDLGLSPP